MEFGHFQKILTALEHCLCEYSSKDPGPDNSLRDYVPLRDAADNGHPISSKYDTAQNTVDCACSGTTSRSAGS